MGYEVLVFKKGNIGRYGGLSSGELTFDMSKEYAAWLFVDNKYDNTKPYLRVNYTDYDYDYQPSSDEIGVEEMGGGNVLVAMMKFKEETTKDIQWFKAEIIGMTSLAFDMPGYIIVAKKKE